MSFSSRICSKKTVIEWGSTAVKIIDSYRDREGITLRKAAKLIPDEALSSELSSLWKHNGFSYANVVLCLDGPETLIRVIDFPHIDKKSLRDSLGFELENHTPFSQNDVYFDYEILDDQGANGNMKLLIALVKRDFLDEKLALLDESAVCPVKVTLNPVVLSNVVSIMGMSSGTAALFDMGNISSMLTVINHGRIVFSREIKKGAQDIFSKLQNIVEARVSSFKDFSIHRHRINRSVLYDVTVDITAEIKMSIDFIESKENISVKKIFIPGGMTKNQDLFDVFSSVIGVETAVFDVENRVIVPDLVKQDIDDSSVDFSVAIGALLEN